MAFRTVYQDLLQFVFFNHYRWYGAKLSYDFQSGAVGAATLSGRLCSNDFLKLNGFFVAGNVAKCLLRRNKLLNVFDGEDDDHTRPRVRTVRNQPSDCLT